MLKYLNISNLALLKSAVLEFDTGLTVISGETGAGKSVLLGALSLLSGNRADKSIVGPFSDACHIQAQFHFNDPSPLNSLLSSLSLPLSPDGTLIIKRVIFKDKPTKITVNDSFVTLSSLQKLGEFWIDFHGAHEPQKLFDENYQLHILDAFANLSQDLSNYKKIYSQWATIRQQIFKIHNDQRLTEEEIAFYQDQLKLLSSLSLSQPAIDQLEQQFNLLQRSEDWQRYTSQIAFAISADKGILSLIRPLIKLSHHLSEIDSSKADPSIIRLKSLLIEFEDLAHEFSQLCEIVDIHPSEIQKIKDKMSTWIEIKRKFGPDLTIILNKKKALEEKLFSQLNIEETLHQLTLQETSLSQQLKHLADILKNKRLSASQFLTQKTQQLLLHLGFKKASIDISLHIEKEFKLYGDSRCEFLFSGNPGQPLLPLNKIASSGEAARVMLALKAVLAEVDHTAVLVFDEVDSNVGGEIGLKVGLELQNLSLKHQVICVTHLPQVAALGQQHWVVSKIQSDDTTQINIHPIQTNPDNRLTEIARMLGDRNSLTALSHAKELLLAN